MIKSAYQPPRAFGGDPELSVISDLIRTLEHAERIVSKRLVEAGAPNLRDLGVLDEIGRSGSLGVRTTQLAERVGISTSRLAHQLKALEQRGLAERRRHETDGRGVVVSLTEGGRSAVARGNSALASLTANGLEALRSELPTSALVKAHSRLVAG